MNSVTDRVADVLRSNHLGLKIGQLAQRVRRPLPELEAALANLKRHGQAFQPAPGLWLPLPFQKANGHTVTVERHRTIEKDSSAAAQRAWRRANPGKVAAAQRAYYQTHKHRWREIYTPRQRAKRAGGRDGQSRHPRGRAE